MDIVESVVIPVIVFFVWVSVVWFIGYVIREFYTWFLKISDIIERLKRIEERLLIRGITKDDGN